MSIFREHKTSADRSASDRARHKQKIEKAIRDGITDVVSEESIIGQDGKKKVRIPVKGIREWQFVYGDNEQQKQPGSAPGTPISRGQIVKKGQQGGQSSRGSGDPSQEKGEEFYEVEITLEELAEYLFSSLNLPDLEKKKFKELLQERPQRKGHRTHGIPPRLDKKKSAIERIKRLSAAKRSGDLEYDEDGNPIFPFHENDLRYHHIETKPKENSNAVIFFMMDTSGSMTSDIKFIARSFYFLLYQFIKHKYEEVKIVFIGHTSEAYETDEDSFFKRGSSGGTMISTAPMLAHKISLERYHPSSWNIYAFHCTDGDNFEFDNKKAYLEFKNLCEISQMVGYCEIKPPAHQPAWSSGGFSTLGKSLENMGPKFRSAIIETKNDIWNAFKKFFGSELG